METLQNNDDYHSFTFGEPQAIDFYDLLGLSRNGCETSSCGRFYEPPIAFSRLMELFRMQEHHESAIRFKANAFAGVFKNNTLLNHVNFSAQSLDYQIFGNAYLEPIKAKAGGKILGYQHVPNMFVRVAVEEKDGFYIKDSTENDWIKSPNLIQFKEYDPEQSIYGMPTYLSSTNSIELNYDSGLYRIKYYRNGSHAGFILLASGHIDKPLLDALQKDLQDVKGDNNFKNIFAHFPKGNPDSLKLIPLAEVGAKDEFINIKNTTRDNVLAVHRVPLALMSIPSDSKGGYGDISKIAKVYYKNEMIPTIRMYESFNQIIGQDILSFDKYEIE